MARQRAVFICPGRGTYNKGELGYLARLHGDRRGLLSMADARRAARSQPPVSALDGAERFSSAVHTRGDNASPLIFTASFADFLAVDREAFDIVAVTGNSMGWYTALACAETLSAEHGFDLVNTMGELMHARGAGGQLVHTTLDEDWRAVPGRRQTLLALAEEIGDVHVSIELGGMIVFAGPDAALDAFAARAPAGPASFPLRLQNHAAFHSPLIAPLVPDARAAIDAGWFRSPSLPLIDGRGQIWRPHASDVGALYDYTLGHQLTRTYDFTRAVAVAVREFAPDCLLVAGPGETLGGAVIQSLLAIGWRGWDSKAAFLADTREDPFVLSLGRSDQRRLVVMA